MQIDLKDEEFLFSETVHIISPRRRILDIPREILIHRDSDAMIQELEDSAREKRKPDLPNLAPRTLELAEKASVSLAEIIKKESDHIWAWRMRNLAGPMRLARVKAGRIVANPPWIVANNMDNGTRKKEIEHIRKRYRLTANVRGSSAKGDLASICSARSISLYLAPNGRAGLVLPGSALINMVWKSWRQGIWGKPENVPQYHCNVSFDSAWCLDGVDPPPFANVPNGTCAVFMSRTEAPRALDKISASIMEGTPDKPKLSTGNIVFPEGGPSVYLQRIKRGCMATPYALLYVPADEVTPVKGNSSIIRIQTRISTKEPWKGISLQGSLEKKTLLRVASSRCLSPFCIRPNMYLVVPHTVSRKGAIELLETDDTRFPADFPHTHGFWKKAERIFLEHRSPNAGATLLENLDRFNTLSGQFHPETGLRNVSAGKTKVFVNSSGSRRFMAARGVISLLADSKFYWVNLSTEEEALYLCGVINADCMQRAWLASKTSKMDFHKNPWRKVPVPEFNLQNHLHKDIARIALKCEEDFTPASRNRGELDSALRRLLPDYAA